jgi:hypothetical protein
MLKATYTYSFLELSGKPKRFIESKPECTIKGYGVSTDAVTLCVLYESIQAFNTINKSMLDKFKLNPIKIKII